jgi:hypothetical protein
MARANLEIAWLGAALLGATGVGVGLFSVPNASARPEFLDAFRNLYPTSTLPDDVYNIMGSECYICHQPEEFSNPGNCYRTQVRSFISEGIPIDQALNLADGLDADGDGVPNGIEILTPRNDGSGSIGYHPGLIGPRGTGPCAPDPNFAYTNRLETPPAAPTCDYDFNQDENVDLLDAQQMAQVFVGLITPEATWLDGDLNGDENADLTDAQLLAAYVVTGTCGV